MKYKQAPPKSGSTGVFRVAWLKKIQRKRVMKKKMRKLWQKKDVQVVVEEELEEVDLGSSSQEPRPILISESLTRKEKSELVLLLQEFKDVFAWDYSKMLGLDPRLVAHTLNVDPEAKPVV